jgi:sigma-B regulation protein RsbU (phosphoserine phosphatase)
MMNQQETVARGATAWRALAAAAGWPEKCLAVALLLWLGLQLLMPASFLGGLMLVLAYLFGFIAAARVFRKLLGKAIWRLRNRLYVAYLFIAVVPIVLILVLVMLSLWGFSGQIAVYLVYSELERRVAVLRNSAETLLRIQADQKQEALERVSMILRERYPGATLIHVVNGARQYPRDGRYQPPPQGWGETSGVVLRESRLYLWAHVKRQQEEITALVPLPRSRLAELAPDLGEVTLVSFDSAGARRRRIIRPHADERTAEKSGIPWDRARMPAAVNALDLEVLWGSQLPVSLWEKPGATETWILGVHTRIAPVLKAVFSQRVEWDQPLLLYGLYAVSILFLVVELASLVVGVSITRTITGAVHNLYEGTQRIKDGDFSHRIAVRGADQLAELGISFNQMTENLERLLKVAKENERLQAELAIAREVQAQLYPRKVPELPAFEIRAMCNPARMVSGDYYDYQLFRDGMVALAMGDVAGKGISAALLMATLASSLRTQLRHCLEDMPAANGAASTLPTSRLVAQLNQHLYAHTSPEKYATFCFGVYSSANRRFTYTNAGHPPPILVRKGAAKRLDVNGIVVGAFPFAQYGESTLDLEPGDLLAFFTDGISEPENEYGEMFGEERLTEILEKNGNKEMDAIVEEILGAVRQWTFAPESQDDMTLLLARQW